MLIASGGNPLRRNAVNVYNLGSSQSLKQKRTPYIITLSTISSYSSNNSVDLTELTNLLILNSTDYFSAKAKEWCLICI